MDTEAIKIISERMQILIYSSRILTIILLFACLPGCRKSNTIDTIPNVPVNFSINLSLPSYSSLNTVGNSVIINSEGYKGIIIYRRAQDEFVAFDLACPYDPAELQAKLQVDAGGLGTVDPNCGSSFSLFDGSKIGGPATRPMKGYNVDYDAGAATVYVYN